MSSTYDGSLNSAQKTANESHVEDCHRCQQCRQDSKLCAQPIVNRVEAVGKCYTALRTKLAASIVFPFEKLTQAFRNLLLCQVELNTQVQFQAVGEIVDDGADCRRDKKEVLCRLP